MDPERVRQLRNMVEVLDDESLRMLGVIVRRMTTHRAKSAARQFRVGQAVRLVSDAHPVKLAGAAAVVVGFSGKHVVVDLDRPVDRFHRGVRCPPGLLSPEVAAVVDDIGAEVARAEQAIENGQARWSETGSSRR